MQKIIDHTNAAYMTRWRIKGADKYNGAYFYSQEIVKHIIPYVKTDRNWVTINTLGRGHGNIDHSIVFIHNNLEPKRYSWLSQYEDLILVCGIESTMDKVKHLGTPIYLPLSVNVEKVEKYRVAEKTKKSAFAGRPGKLNSRVPFTCDRLCGLPRNILLREMAKYETIYAVGRTAIEAKILNCQIGIYDPRFPDPNIWKVLDCRDAAKILQKELNKIDGKNKCSKQD